MIDTGRLFDQARTLLSGAVSTSGTRARFTQSTKVRDRASLSTTTTVTASADHDAIVVVIGGEGAGEVTPGIRVSAGDWRIVMAGGTADYDESWDVSVVGAKDVRLAGRTARVIGTVVDSTGAHTTVYAHPYPQGSA